ncbi:C40 family peptidase [Paenibacillus sp. YPG26]|uniref:C40 family peptidase n=1 Tax=Paenibacillus sp. YPG26 TaxID=2878915 RepID=UPI00203CE7D2|nr:C40 family peptidase [Paenibacillus sp. YPG26]USB31887.1 NlpC/P60 family protein [Paenibacillus sp. YPG26]
MKSQALHDSKAAIIKKNVYRDSGGKTWIPLRVAAKTLGLNYKENANAVLIGFSDPIYEVYPGRSTAVSKGTTITLKDRPVHRDNQICISLTDLSALLGTETAWNSESGRLEISKLPPLKEAANGQDQRLGGFRALSSVDTQELVAYAKRFLGVAYEFGADEYTTSRTFDCSSFTQHVFKQFNVDLPRLASEQAKRGTAVERSELRTGDLIFFTVPGRFQDDRIPGHVGIYIGDGNFIHTWGGPGVQISPLDSGYWQRVILTMRRVL